MSSSAAEDLGAETGLLHRFEGGHRRRVAFERLLCPLLEAFDVLSTAVITDHPAKLQVRQLVHELRQDERLLARWNAGASADRDVDHDICHDPHLLGRRGQIARVLRIVDRLDVLRIAFSDGHGPSNLARAHVACGHQDLLDPSRKERLRLAHLRRTHTNRTAAHLELRDGGRLVGLGVRTTRDAGGRQLPLHGGNVLLQLVEIDAQRRRIELPLGHAQP